MAINQIEVLKQVKSRLNILDDTTDVVLTNLILDVMNIALNSRFPFHEDKTVNDLPPRMENWVTRASVQVYESIGMLNVKQYSENGLSFTRSAVRDGISVRTLNEIIPKAGYPQ